MQIAALKKLNKGMTLYIMDRNGSSAKAGKSAIGYSGGGQPGQFRITQHGRMSSAGRDGTYPQPGRQGFYPPCPAVHHAPGFTMNTSCNGKKATLVVIVPSDALSALCLHRAALDLVLWRCLAVAKELNKRGFGRAFVMAGGFQSWANSKLKTKLTSTVRFAEKAAAPKSRLVLLVRHSGGYMQHSMGGG